MLHQKSDGVDAAGIRREMQRAAPLAVYLVHLRPRLQQYAHGLDLVAAGCSMHSTQKVVRCTVRLRPGLE